MKIVKQEFVFNHTQFKQTLPVCEPFPQIPRLKNQNREPRVWKKSKYLSDACNKEKKQLSGSWLSAIRKKYIIWLTTWPVITTTRKIC